MEQSFSEKEPEKKYNITKFNFTCDDKDDDLCNKIKQVLITASLIKSLYFHHH